MIFMLCGNCQMDMLVADIQYVPSIDGKSFKMIYHITCENNHKSTIPGDLIILKPDTAEERVIKYLIEQSERRYGKIVSD